MAQRQVGGIGSTGANPQAVTIYDGSGNPVSVVSVGARYAFSVAVLDSAGNQVSSFGTDPVGLKNVAAATINPATEDTLAARLDIAMSALRDAIAGASPSTATLYVLAQLETLMYGLLGTIDADTGNIATSAAVMDDWDESDRAKVNPIVGQAGIAAGAGAVGAMVPRMTLASDDPAVAALASIKTAIEIMDDWDASDRCKVAAKLVYDSITDTATVDSSADQIWDASAHTDAVRLIITNRDDGALYVGEDSSVTTTDFMFYIPPYQHVVVDLAYSSGANEDLYGIRAGSDTGPVKVYALKYG